MYVIQNKKQLHSFIESIRIGLETRTNTSFRPSKFKELIASCMFSSYADKQGFRSYASFVAKVESSSGELEEYDFKFVERLHERLVKHPYTITIPIEVLYEVYHEAHVHLFWDERASYESILDAAWGC